MKYIFVALRNSVKDVDIVFWRNFMVQPLSTVPTSIESFLVLCSLTTGSRDSILSYSVLMIEAFCLRVQMFLSSTISITGNHNNLKDSL